MVAFSLLAGGAILGAAWASWLVDSHERPTRLHPPVTPTHSATPTPMQPEVVVVEAQCPAPAPAPAPTVIIQQPTPRFGPGSCPERDTPNDRAIGVPWARADRQSSARFLDATPLVGVAVSRSRDGHLAVWTRDEIFVSDDDGRRFRELLRGPGHVYDVAVDCNGGVFAVRGNTRALAIGYSRDRQESWRPLGLARSALDDHNPDREPDFASVSLATGGGWIALTAPGELVVGTGGAYDPVLAASRDGGASWAYVQIPDPELTEGIDVTGIDERGRLTLLGFEGDCMYDGTAVHQIELETGTPATKQLSRSYQTHDATVSTRWTYADVGCDHELCAFDLRKSDCEYECDSAWVQVTGLDRPSAPTRGSSPHNADEDADNETNGDAVLDADGAASRREFTVLENRRVYALNGAHVWRLRGSRATRIGADIPATVHFAAMDTSYRLVGLSADRRLVRWSPRHGLRVLPGQVIE